jgi:hypothetical protein
VSSYLLALAKGHTTVDDTYQEQSVSLYGHRHGAAVGRLMSADAAAQRLNQRGALNA